MAQFIKIASTTDLAPGEAKCVEVAGKKIALFNLDGTFFAIDDTCTHRGGPLSEGEVSGEEVTCPWHGAVYNIKIGEVLGPPAPRGVASYAVRVQGSDVEVRAPGAVTGEVRALTHLGLACLDQATPPAPLRARVRLCLERLPRALAA